MIAAWMVYCTVIGMLLVGAAHLAEQLVLGRGGSTRRVWVFALVLAVTLPALGILVKDDPVITLASGVDLASAYGTRAIMEGVDLLSVLDKILIQVWGGASAGLGILVVAALVSVARRRRFWAREEIDGVPVLVSDDVGPAVVGIVRTSIVLPRWAVSEEAAQRALLLKHEQEHVRAGDARLLLLAALVLVAMPWNVALWRLALRLRTAIEVDCDHRVMGGAGVDARSYGALLLAVGRRRSPRAALATLGLTRSRSLLEMRIDRMTLRRRHGLAGALATAGAAAMLLAAAWSLPQPVRAVDVSGVPLPCPTSAAAASRLPDDAWSA